MILISFDLSANHFMFDYVHYHYITFIKSMFVKGVIDTITNFYFHLISFQFVLFTMNFWHLVDD